MPQMPAKVTGKTYQAMVDVLRTAAQKVNGATADGDARLTNAHAVAVFQGLRRGTQRAKKAAQLPEAAWQMVWLAYGWENWGEKFIVTRAQAKAMYPEDVLEDFWTLMYRIAQDLDGARTVVRALPMDYSFTAYQAGARDAWGAMQRFTPQGQVIVDPRLPDVELPTLPPPDELPLPRIPTPGGAGWLLLALVLLLASRNRKGRR